MRISRTLSTSVAPTATILPITFASSRPKMRVLVTQDLPQVVEKLAAQNFDVMFLPDLQDRNLGAVLRASDYDILVVESLKVTAAILAEWNGDVVRPRLIVRAGSNTGNIALDAARDYGITVAKTTGANCEPLVKWIQSQLPKQTKVVALVGFGPINQEVARLFPKQTQVRVCSRTQPDTKDATWTSNIVSACQDADCVVVSLPNGAEGADDTTKLVNAAALSVLASCAKVISISPTPVLDLKTLQRRDIDFAICASFEQLKNFAAEYPTAASRSVLTDASQMKTPAMREAVAQTVLDRAQAFRTAPVLQDFDAQNVAARIQDAKRAQWTQLTAAPSATVTPLFNSAPKRIIVVGGGIVGFSTAYALAKHDHLYVRVLEAQPQAAMGATGSQGRHITLGEGTPFGYQSQALSLMPFPRGFSTRELSQYPERTQKFLRLYRKLSESDPAVIESAFADNVFLGRKGLEVWRQWLASEPKLSAAAKPSEGSIARIYCDANGLGKNRELFERHGIKFNSLSIFDVAQKTGMPGVISLGQAALSQDGLTLNTTEATRALAELVAERPNAQVMFNARVQQVARKTNGDVDSLLLSDGRKLAADLYILATGADTLLSYDLPIEPVGGANITIQTRPSDPRIFGAKIFGELGMVNVSAVDNKGLGQHWRLTGGFFLDPSCRTDSIWVQTSHRILETYASRLAPEIYASAVRDGRSHWSPGCFRPLSADSRCMVGPWPHAKSNLWVNLAHGKNGASVGPLLGQMLASAIVGRRKIPSSISASRFRGWR
jgi:glycine/D-amino acid oxidase-like deaminating enzyme/lactate dehydrogenase-like 2-hydroxyacid dehydrogenase